MASPLFKEREGAGKYKKHQEIVVLPAPDYPPTGEGYVKRNSAPKNNAYIDHLVGGERNDALENTRQMYAIGNGQQFYKDGGSDQLRHHRTDATGAVQHSSTDMHSTTDKVFHPKNRLHNMFA